MTPGFERGWGAPWHWNTAKRSCPVGHPYDSANTRRWRSKRYCKRCVREGQRRRYWAAKGAAA